MRGKGRAMDASGFSQAKQDQTRRLSNSVLRRTLVNVVVFAVVYLALFLGFMNTLGSSLSNLAYNLVGQNYWVHTAIANLFLVCVAVGFIAGIVLVVRSGINRALRYFDLLLDSVTDVLAKREGPVVLPSELAPTALFLNGIKAEGERSERAAGKSHYPLSKMLALAFDGITSLSIKPIKMIIGMGVIVAFISFIGIIWAVVEAILGKTVMGWASTTCIICFLSGVQLISVGVIGEYIGKIYMEVKQRPRYIISERTWERHDSEDIS